MVRKTQKKSRLRTKIANGQKKRTALNINWLELMCTLELQMQVITGHI